MRFLLPLVWLALAAAGCSESHSSDDDAGSHADASPRADAGPRTDASVPPFECAAEEVAEVRMPRVLPSSDPLPVTLRSAATPGGCSCAPELLSPALELVVGIVVCDCCEGCECIDPLYEVSGLHAAPPVGDHEVRIVAGIPSSRPLAVRDLGSCRPAPDPTTLEVIAPAGEAISSGPRWWWLHVMGSELVCCAEPLPALRALEGEPGAYTFELLSCTADPCDCIPKEPTPWETWVPITEPGPGSYTVRVGGASATFTIPLGP